MNRKGLIIFTIIGIIVSTILMCYYTNKNLYGTFIGLFVCLLTGYIYSKSTE